MNVSVVPDSLTSVEPSVSVTVNPGISSSVVVIDTCWSATASKLSSEASWTMEIVVEEIWDPSIIPRSSMPLAVIVCGVSQFSGVNVIESRSTVCVDFESDVRLA